MTDEECRINLDDMSCPFCGGPYPWVLHGHNANGSHIWYECDHNVEITAPPGTGIVKCGARRSPQSTVYCERPLGHIPKHMGASPGGRRFTW